jgi:hypothetical protein
LNRQGLWRFEAGHFVLAVRRPPEGQSSRRKGERLAEDPMQFDRIVRVVGDREPPWIAMAYDDRPLAYRLHRFTPGSATEAPRFEAIPIVRDRMHLPALDAMAWGPSAALVSTDAGLFVLAVKSGALAPLHALELTGMVGRLARDRHGRAWLGGHGLWVLDPDGHARVVHPALPFFGGQEVTALTPCGEADILATLEDRGAALISLKSRNRAEAEPEDELSRPLASSREQTVMAHVPWIRDADVGKRQKAAEAFWGLVRDTADLIDARGLGRFGGVEHTDHYVLFFHGPDADALAATIAPRLAASDTVTSLWLVKRYGPPGSQSVVHVIKPAR